MYSYLTAHTGHDSKAREELCSNSWGCSYPVRGARLVPSVKRELLVHQLAHQPHLLHVE